MEWGIFVHLSMALVFLYSCTPTHMHTLTHTYTQTEWGIFVPLSMALVFLHSCITTQMHTHTYIHTLRWSGASSSPSLSRLCSFP